jgi:phospholipid/cholesterol/gamma-HCH transport system substrate-binding protein
MMFAEASKIDCGTPVRMKGVQIGLIAAVKLYPSHVEAVAQVMDSANVIPRSARVDINLLGLAADPWIDITPSPDSTVRRDHGPHHPECLTDGLIVCHNGVIDGYQGGSTDYMMKFFLSQHDRTRVKAVRV